MSNMQLVREYVTWWWRRDSNTACLIIIDLAQTMSARDLINMADYLHGLAGQKKENEHE